VPIKEVQKKRREGERGWSGGESEIEKR